MEVLSYPLSAHLDFHRHYPIPPPAGGTVQKISRYLAVFVGLVIGMLIPSNQLRNYFNDYRFGLRRLHENLKKKAFDLLIVEDLQLLPLAVNVRGSARILFDAREYYPKQQEDSILFRLLEKSERIRLCKEYFHQCEGLVTVSDGLAQEYERNFGVCPRVIRSVPWYHKSAVNDVDPAHIRIVHHGFANRNRKLANLIEILLRLDERFTLDLYLTRDLDHIRELKRKAKGDKRIRFMKPVPFQDIVSVVNRYDIGLFYVEPTTFNLKHCLPNKLFEFIQARLMVAIGPSPDMANLVRAYRCGVVSQTFDPAEMVKLLNELTPEQIMKAKRNSDLAAKELCFEVEGKKLLRVIDELPSPKPRQ